MKELKNLLQKFKAVKGETIHFSRSYAAIINGKKQSLEINGSSKDGKMDLQIIQNGNELLNEKEATLSVINKKIDSLAKQLENKSTKKVEKKSE